MENNENAEEELESPNQDARSDERTGSASDRNFKPRTEDPIGERATKRGQSSFSVGEDGPFPRSGDGEGVLEKRSGSTIYLPEAGVVSDSSSNEPPQVRSVSRIVGLATSKPIPGQFPRPGSLGNMNANYRAQPTSW